MEVNMLKNNLHSDESMKWCRIMATCFLICILGTPYTSGQERNCACSDSASFAAAVKEKLVAHAFWFPYGMDTMQYFSYWMPGDILLESGKVVRNESIRYHGIMDALLWFRSSDHQTAVIEKEQVAGFNLYKKDGSLYARFRKMRLRKELSSDSADFFLQVLTEGPVSLYKLNRVELVRNTGRMEKRPRYYLLYKDEMSLFRPARRNLLDRMGEEKEQMRLLLRRNHLWVSQEEKLIRALNLFNSAVAKSQP